MNDAFDVIVVGAGSAGCAVAFRLAEQNVGTVAVIEAGATDRTPNVRVPFGLVYTMGSRQDWRLATTPQAGADGRAVKVPRGKMLGGSSSINSMVWFRGRRDDFDAWGIDGWRWADVEADFEAVEQRIRPQRLPEPHDLSEAFARALGDNGDAPPTPERESAGVFHVNMRDGARFSAADAFLHPAVSTGRVAIIKSGAVDRVTVKDGRANGVVLADGRVISARRAIVLSAGAIASPAILMRSGIGPANHLAEHGIDVKRDAPEVGANLHDHPAIGVHHVGAGSGYGLVLRQLPAWALSPFDWLFRRRGRLISNCVEAGAFFRSGAVPDDPRPDCQVHFIPFMMGHHGRTIVWGEGYFADVCVCRPASRGTLRLMSARAEDSPAIDLNLFGDDRDMATLVAGFRRLRDMLANAPFGKMRAPEVFPGDAATTDEEIRAHIRARCGTAYHPVGTVRMGEDENSVLTPSLAVRGIGGLHVADASVMPSITSANTNAPSMMIGYRGGGMIAAALKNGR